MPISREEMLRRGLTPHEIIHSQHRRAEWRDYHNTGLYMVTLCTEGRCALFGELAGHMRAERGSADFPHTQLSALGQVLLKEELPKIHRTYPAIELWQAVIMPDHLHLLLYIREPLPQGKHLGHVISSFKGGCSRAWWKMMGGEGTAADAAGTTAPSAAALVPVASAAVQSAGGAVPPHRPPLFEAGYHDRIIGRPGMLENIKRYMADNPLRAVMRKELPRLLERRLHIRVGGHEYAAFGSLFLLKRAEKEQVFYHRKDKQTGAPTETTADFAASRERQLGEAREGVVLVSPKISTGERLVIDAAIDEGLPVIHLQKEPITRYWKPERRRFEACARGNLLILAPWGLDEELRTAAGTAAAAAAPSDYSRFHRLNELAAEICATTEAVLVNVGEITGEMRPL